MKNHVLVIGCLWILTLAAAAQVNNYYVSPAGSDANPGTQAHPWLTLAHANAAATLGANGTIIHFGDGTYLGTPNMTCVGVGNTPFCITHGGTGPTQQLTYQCDNGLNGNAGQPGTPGHCLIRASSDVSTQELFGIQNSNYLIVQGFDIGGDGTHPATLYQSAVLIQPKDGTGNFIQINHNFVHDISSAANDGGPYGVGCPREGTIGVNGGGTTAATISRGDVFIGNWINNIGLLSNTACTQTHGIYPGGGVNYTIENNICGNVPGSCYKAYPHVCSSVVSNNLAFHAGWWGILVQDTGSGICAAKGFAVGNSTIDNNIVINTGFNHACGAIAEATGSGSNKYTNNLLLGNAPLDAVVQNCSSNTSVAGVSGTVNGSSGAAIGNTLLNYRNDGTGDYHLIPASFAVGAGSTACVSGGISPCTPATSFTGLPRPTPPSIGHDELATSATQLPNAPTNLTATVQ